MYFLVTVDQDWTRQRVIVDELPANQRTLSYCMPHLFVPLERVRRRHCSLRWLGDQLTLSGQEAPTVVGPWDRVVW